MRWRPLCVAAPLLLTVGVVVGVATGQTTVRDYTRSDGTHVSGYTRGAGTSTGTSAGLDGEVSIAGASRANPAAGPGLCVVGGYFRRDGTYVAPHVRTVADGVKQNNLSWRESFRAAGFSDADILDMPGIPLDAEPAAGYVAAFPELIVPTSVDDQAARIELAAELAALGAPFDWRRHPQADLIVFVARARKAAALKAQGIEVDWLRTSYDRLIELECIAAAERTLKELGVSIDPKTTTCRAASDVVNRVKAAARIHALGREVVWQKFSLDELLEIEQKLAARKR